MVRRTYAQNYRNLARERMCFEALRSGYAQNSPLKFCSPVRKNFVRAETNKITPRFCSFLHGQNPAYQRARCVILLYVSRIADFDASGKVLTFNACVTREPVERIFHFSCSLCYGATKSPPRHRPLRHRHPPLLRQHHRRDCFPVIHQCRRLPVIIVMEH